MEISIRRATADDVGAILRLIKELAVYEREPLESVIVTEEVLLRDGFGDQPMFHVLIAETQGESGTEAIGMAFYFYTYSTWYVHSCLRVEVCVFLVLTASGRLSMCNRMMQARPHDVSRRLGRVPGSPRARRWHEAAPVAGRGRPGARLSSAGVASS
jgi:hypothetical protein